MVSRPAAQRPLLYKRLFRMERPSSTPISSKAKASFSFSMQSATPPEKKIFEIFCFGRSSAELSGLWISYKSVSAGEREMLCARSCAILSVTASKRSCLHGSPSWRGTPMEAAILAADGLTYSITRSFDSLMSLPPISKQVLETVSPPSNTTMFVVPPPISMLMTTQSFSMLYW